MSQIVTFVITCANGGTTRGMSTSSDIRLRFAKPLTLPGALPLALRRPVLSSRRLEVEPPSSCVTAGAQPRHSHGTATAQQQCIICQQLVRLHKANKFRTRCLPIRMFTLTYFDIPYEHSTQFHFIFGCVSLAANSRAAFRLSIEKPVTRSP